MEFCGRGRGILAKINILNVAILPPTERIEVWKDLSCMGKEARKGFKLALISCEVL